MASDLPSGQRADTTKDILMVTWPYSAWVMIRSRPRRGPPRVAGRGDRRLACSCLARPSADQGRTWSFAGGLAMSADNPPLRDEDIATSQGGSTGPQTGDTIDETDRAGGDADGTDRADGVDGTDVSDSGSGGDDADGTDADGTDADGSDADGTDVSDSGLGGDADGTDR